MAAVGDLHRLEAEAQKRISALQFPLPEAELHLQFTLQISQVISKFPLVAGKSAALEGSWKGKAVRWNLVAVLKRVRKACKVCVKAATRDLPLLKLADTDTVLQSLGEVSNCIQEKALISANSFISVDSEAWKDLKIDKIVEEFEGEIVQKYLNSLPSHFHWLETLFQTRYLLTDFDVNMLSCLNFDGFERFSLENEEERRRKLVQDVNLMTFGAAPRAILREYERKLGFCMEEERNKLMKGTFLTQISWIMGTQMEEIAAGRLKVSILCSFLMILYVKRVSKM